MASSLIFFLVLNQRNAGEFQQRRLADSASVPSFDLAQHDSTEYYSHIPSPSSQPESVASERLNHGWYDDQHIRHQLRP
ncbi:hypothetical protein OC844_000338 [Tilletia horrida]|nr:hypothetical protein OC844_000338 [Tilletia horrida]